ncbi:MAG: molybdenum cofactor guanylyltransferase [Pyrinomonadaceae bacterium]
MADKALMTDIESFILIGGASRRMGSDKARLNLGGRTFVARIADALSPITNTISIVGARTECESFNLPVVEDVYAGWGALGGVHAALRACRTEWAAIVACDLPFASAELFVRMASMREDFDAVAPLQSDGRPQPLCALYRAQTCVFRAEELIEAHERRARALLRVVATRFVSSDELADLRDAPLLFANINTAEDYARALKTVSNAEVKEEHITPNELLA